MAVYTEVGWETLEAFLKTHYDLGKLLRFEGIADGIENSNYKLETEQGRFILTLFEKRAPEKDLPFFLDFTEHLVRKGLPCPHAIPGKDGKTLRKLVGKKAVIITFLPGQAVMSPAPPHCEKAGQLSAKMHAAAEGFNHQRINPLGLAGLEDIFIRIRNDMEQRLPDLYAIAGQEFDLQKALNHTSLGSGVVHADLFPDNVFFENDNVSGVIDFYFAATEAFAYDLAVTANSWCFAKDGEFLKDNFSALVHGYESVRPFRNDERQDFPALLRRAALRFLMTRSEDWLKPPEGVMGIVKDPYQYGKILSFHRGKSHIDEYF